MSEPLPPVPAHEAPDATLVTAPRDGSVTLVDTPDALRRFVEQIDQSAPVAIDAERAQSFRYSSKAYLIQFHQTSLGTRLLDPVGLAPAGGLADLSSLNDALAGCEWVLHAASQDLPCLAEVGLVPRRLFDTELAGRLLDLERVSLSPMLTHYLGVELAKAHSADDWSRRPLPPDWLTYASLDVDYLLELRAAVADDLDATGKRAWAEQEFADAIGRFAVPPADDPEHWRHVKGLGRLRQARQLGIAKNLWHVRDDIARERDIFPGRILPDAALVDAATVLSRLKPAEVGPRLLTLDGFRGPLAKRQHQRWTDAVTQALRADPKQLPQREPGAPFPPPRLWDQVNEAAAHRWALGRPAIIAVAEQHNLPPENLMTVATLAEVLWPDDVGATEQGLRHAMDAAHMRPWQQDLAAPALAEALA